MGQNKVKLNVDKRKALLEVNKIQSAGTKLVQCQFLWRRAGVHREWLL